MGNSQGFWSYVHDDDKAEGGRIRRLAKDIVDQYQMFTGEDIHLLFLDKEDLQWGDEWRKEIDSSLATVAFFIPVMTPRYFMKPYCRHELQYFLHRATELGIKELVLPLHYINVPTLSDEKTKDELVKLLGTIQWVDWRELRFADVASSEYRQAVAQLAEKLVEANKNAEESVVPTESQFQEMSEESQDDEPGSIDKLAVFEEMLSQLPETVNIMAQDIAQIGQIMRDATEDIKRADAQKKGFAARVIVSKQATARLSEPIERIWSLSNTYASQLHGIDSGFHIILERAPIEIKENPAAIPNLCAFFGGVRKMSGASKQAIESLENMLTSAEPLERMSRDLRPVLRRLRHGLTILIESSNVIQEWVRMIDSSGVNCEDPSA